jgi:hypothetical protein|tara:strand:+ start:116 stop:322 length:207 start_codon:yes stop_codon:yes gene_type:complete
MKKIVNGELVNMTKSEIEQKNKDDSDYAVELEQFKINEQNYKTKQASGKQKLKDLGLDDDEIKALLGV